MAVMVEDGFLVERFPRSDRTSWRTKIVSEKPEGTLCNVPVVTEDGQRYRTGWVYPPGIRQGRAVAWLADCTSRERNGKEGNGNNG